MIRIGHSTDIHRLEEGYKLIIGGVPIKHEKGSVGHSDADCLLHSISEALLGSLALGDLGSIFPDTDPSIKGIDSSIILSKIFQMVQNKGYHVVNIDCMIFLEKPKLKDHILSIRNNIANMLEIPVDCVSVKATTGEKVGIVGREEAIVTETVVLVSND